MPASSAALVILCLAAVCGTEHNTVYLHHGSGRLAARMTPYTLLLVLREKHGLQVMVDRGVADAVSKYFTLPRRLAVIEVNNYMTLTHCQQCLVDALWVEVVVLFQYMR